jgi:L-iditol 2-dehydrogenase
MRAAVLYRPGDVRVEAVTKPQIKPDHALVRIAACGVCGSDIPRVLIKGAHKLPIICGHEFSGQIAELGERMEGWRVGELVTAPPLIPCGTCEQCLRGVPSRCEDYDYFGSRRDGAYTEFALVPKTNLLRVPTGISPETAALTDPAAIALHALMKTGLSAGQTFAVVGCGAIGLFAIQWAKIMGASRIVGVDIEKEAIDLAMIAGADAGFYDPASDYERQKFDVVLEAAGARSSINTAIRLVRPGGEAVFIGIPTADVLIELPTFEHLLRQEVKLHGSWNSFSAPFPGREWHATLNAFSKGTLRTDFFITHRLDIAELPATFEKLRTRAEFSSKILFHA